MTQLLVYLTMDEQFLSIMDMGMGDIYVSQRLMENGPKQKV